MDRRSSGILASHDPVDEVHGLACRRSVEPVMRRAHRHDDVELALAVDGWVEHEHAGRRLRAGPGTLVVFWAALPHRVRAVADGASVRWLTVPLVEALTWDVEGHHTARLLSGAFDVHDDRGGDAVAMGRWETDLASGGPLRRAAGFEIRAHLDRLASITPSRDPRPEPGGHAARVARMAAFVAGRFRDPITVADVAAHVHLHPATASAAFRAATGAPPGAFLLQCRLAEAQRLLLVTEAGVDEVARRAGFGSLSAFYAHFTRDHGLAPAAYRRSYRG